MGRIEEIKARIESEFYVFSEENIEGTLNEYREAHDDIEYLLSRLQTAEKALNEILDVDGRNQVLCVHDIAREALEQIQKE